MKKNLELSWWNKFMKPGSFKKGGGAGDSKAYPVLSDGPNFLRPFLLASLVALHFGKVSAGHKLSQYIRKSKKFAECSFSS